MLSAKILLKDDFLPNLTLSSVKPIYQKLIFCSLRSSLFCRVMTNSTLTVNACDFFPKIFDCPVLDEHFIRFRLTMINF